MIFFSYLHFLGSFSMCSSAAGLASLGRLRFTHAQSAAPLHADRIQVLVFHLSGSWF
jgi:hypothetical protein